MTDKQVHRNFVLDVPESYGNPDTIRIAISTEAPYLRNRIAGYARAYEVLGHTPGEIDFSWFTAETAPPFLYEHKTDIAIGALSNISLDSDRVLRADVEFNSDTFAQNIKTDILAGRRKRISVGYEVFEYTDTGTFIDGIPVVRATRFKVYEASLVSIPADINALVGRNSTTEDLPMDTTDTTTSPDITDEVVEELVDAVADAVTDIVEEALTTDVVASDDTSTEDEVKTDDAEGDDEEVITDEDESSSKSLHINNNPTAQKASSKEYKIMDKNLIKQLGELAKRHGKQDDLATWIAEDRTVESVKAELLDSKSNEDKVIGAPALHLNKSEKTMDNAVRSFLRGDNSELAEMGVDSARRMGRTINQGVLYLPVDVPMIVRTGTGVTNTGTSAVGKNYMSYIDTLREGSTFAKVGGSIETFNDITSRPYFSTPATASMVHDSGSSSDKEVVVGTRTWSPKRASARYLYQNSMGRLNGTYDFESELTKELTAEGVRIVDQQVWAGSGTGNEITGLVNDSNITLLTNTGSFTVLNAANMWSTVAAVNGVTDGQFAFVIAPAVKGQALSSGSFGAGSGISVMSQVADSMGAVYSSNYLGAGTIANSYASVAGDFSKATLGLFGPVEITRDPYTLLQTGQSVLQLDAYIDAVAWAPAAFVRWKTITV